MSVGSSTALPPALPLRPRALTRALAGAPTLHHALLLLLALDPEARFEGVHRDGDRIRVLFRLGAPKHALLALDAETNGALRCAALVDAAREPPANEAGK